MSSQFDLAGKRALISGATGHLGLAMAGALGRAGATVYINSRSRERCMHVVNELREVGVLAEPAVFDVTSVKSVQNFFNEGLTEIPLHILINNAYRGGGGTIETSAPEDYGASYDVTVTSAHQLLNASLKSLRLAVEESGDASVINIASMYGMVSPDQRVYGTPNGTNPPFYGAAKAALIHWSRYAACEFGKEGIRVNSLSPGPFPSEAVQKSTPEFMKILASKVPVGRIGQANEIGGPVVFLASPAARFVNGANLVVDGGWTSW